MSKYRHSTTHIIAVLLVGVLFVACAQVAGNIHQEKWSILYETRRELQQRPYITVLSESYSEDVVSLDNLTYQLDIEHKGILEITINYSNGFKTKQQFFVTQVGSCQTHVELRETIDYAIDHYDQLLDACLAGTT